MGTRADFYVGKGADAEWLGSIAWDGYPDGISDAVKNATTAADFREAVEAFFQDGRDDVTRPAQGWPWPWNDSNTTDYAYAFSAGRVEASSFGSTWFLATDEEREDASGEKPIFPDMSARQAVTLGARSGVMVIGRP